MKKIFLLLFLVSIVAGVWAQKRTKTDRKPLEVFLVRHAEKVDQSRDSELSSAGIERAKLLAEILQDTQIEFIHSTNFKRTINTAQPLADLLNIEIEIYNPGKLAELVKKLEKTGGRHLIVGHSNTTPEMVKLLGGKPGSEITETEYNRLYILTTLKNKEISSMLLRYGNQ